MRKLVFLLAFLVSSLFRAQEVYRPLKDTSSFRQRVDKMARETNSIESDFVQVKDLSMLSEKITSKGSFYFKKQNSLRWQYVSPYSYVIVINNDKILIKDEDHKVKKYDMNANKVFREINDIMISCVNGNVLKSGKFQFKYYEGPKSYKLELVPVAKNMRESLKKINMYFDKEVTSVIKLEMIEPGDDVTTIDFINKKLNAGIDPQKFMLK